MPRRFGARWIIGTVLVAAICSACIAAMFWQLRRLDERRATNAQVRARAERVVDLPPEGFGADPDEDALVFRQVRMRGTYDTDHELLVRFRSRRGLPGYEVVTPLVTGGGTVLVNRGWVPLDEGDRWPVADAAPPAGEVEVEGLVSPAEGGGPRVTPPSRPGKPPIVAAVDPRRLTSEVAHRDLYALPILAAGSSSRYPVPVDPPDLGEGPHFSYAVQWFLFASVGIVGWITLLFTRGPFARRKRTLPA